jgi:hypothetical protein
MSQNIHCYVDVKAWLGLISYYGYLIIYAAFCTKTNVILNQNMSEVPMYIIPVFNF